MLTRSSASGAKRPGHQTGRDGTWPSASGGRQLLQWRQSFSWPRAQPRQCGGTRAQASSPSGGRSGSALSPGREATGSSGRAAGRSRAMQERTRMWAWPEIR